MKEKENDLSNESIVIILFLFFLINQILLEKNPTDSSFLLNENKEKAKKSV